jgi:uncharacterized protein YkwD
VPRLPRHLAATAIAAAIALAAPAGASASACADVDLLPAADNLPRVAASTLCLLNEERAAQGLRPVTENAALTRASRDYSQLMVDQRFFAHESPAGTDVVDRVTRAGYLSAGEGGWIVGENLAWAQGVLSSPRNVMKAWMESSGHRRNILSGDYEEIGVGVVLGTPVPGPAGATFTTDFGTREDRAAAPGAAPAASGGDKAQAASTKAATKKAKSKAAARARAAKLRAAKARAAKLRAARVRAAKARAARARAARARAAR